MMPFLCLTDLTSFEMMSAIFLVLLFSYLFQVSTEKYFWQQMYDDARQEFKVIVLYL